jgi:hypothetical protein
MSFYHFFSPLHYIVRVSFHHYIVRVSFHHYIVRVSFHHCIVRVSFHHYIVRVSFHHYIVRVSFHHYIVRVSFFYMILIIPLHCLCKLRQILIFTLIYLYFIFRHACIMWSVVLGVNSRTFIRDYLLVLFLRNAVNSVGVTSLEPDYPHYICLPVPTQVLNFQRFVCVFNENI